MPIPLLPNDSTPAMLPALSCQPDTGGTSDTAPWKTSGEEPATEGPLSLQPRTLRESISELPPGLSAHPVPYTFRTDDIVAGILLAGCFLMAFFLSRSWPRLRLYLKDFLYARTDGETAGEHTETEAGGQALVIALACFAGGILHYDYMQAARPEITDAVAPHVLIAADTLLCLLLILGKTAVYAAVNGIFFSAAKRRAWHESYMTSLTLLAALIVPLTLPVVFFDTDFIQLQISLLAAYAAVKFLLFLRCYRIFFGYPLGHVHIILYFCALEIAPALILWRTMFWTNTILTTDA